MTRPQSEALTEHITEVLCVNKEKISESFVSKAALEKVCSDYGLHQAHQKLTTCWSVA